MFKVNKIPKPETLGKLPEKPIWDLLVKTDSFPPYMPMHMALNLSIDKWEYITEWIRDNKRMLCDGGVNTCALCHFSQFCTESMHHMCEGCLIFEWSKEVCCYCTPYILFTQAATWEEQLVAADLELRFLVLLKDRV